MPLRFAKLSIQGIRAALVVDIRAREERDDAVAHKVLPTWIGLLETCLSTVPYFNSHSTMLTIRMPS